MQQNVLEIKVQYTTIPVGLICFDPFSGACESNLRLLFLQV